MTVGPLLGRFDFDLFGRTAYAYSLATLFVLFLLARRIVHSPFGLSLMSIRRNPLRAGALGVPVNRRLIAVYTIAAAYAGAAGALLAQTTAYVSLEVLEFNRSADVLLALIIGGTGWLYGGIAGALIFKILQDTLSASAPQFWMFWMGLFLVVLALVGRERLMGGVRGLLARARP
jgi:branched-chain amino acid transport system permease protein